MSKAEEKSLKAYPKKIEWVGNQWDGAPFDVNSERRVAYKQGYEQAEKELIDKAIGWIVEIYNCHEIMQYSDSCEPPLSELIEWFKNYMKEENINSK
jgi:hypothetical protein